MSKSVKNDYATAEIFVRWNTWNRVCVGMAFFENDKMVELKIKPSIVNNITKYFLKSVQPSFIMELLKGLQQRKPTIKEWNHQANEQNGLIEMNKASFVLIDELTDEFKKQYSNIYLTIREK